MFILRTVLTDKEECNTALGSKYRLTRKTHIDQKSSTKRDESIAKFESMTSYAGVEGDHNKEVFAVITTEAGNVHIPLFERNQYYIMTESGKTFANLSFR